MPTYTYDARINTTIEVVADDEREAQIKAEQILDRLVLTDPETDEEYGMDTEDGVELTETDEDEDGAYEED